MQARRRFLQLLAAAPVSVPVAAKEAAVGMGLFGPIGPIGPIGAAGANVASASQTVQTRGDVDREWITTRIKDLFSKETIRHRHLQALSMARALDPDLAAMRSVSPAWAYRQQVARCEQMLLNNERSWIERDCRLAGLPFASLWQTLVG